MVNYVGTVGNDIKVNDIRTNYGENSGLREYYQKFTDILNNKGMSMGVLGFQ
jgi:hypothetical protein